jgi:hypothetical protein
VIESPAAADGGYTMNTASRAATVRPIGFVMIRFGLAEGSGKALNVF